MIINGRFRHSEPGGFRRYATEVSARVPGAQVITPPARVARGAAGQIWEQTVLGFRARNDVLWSPATSGPIRHRRHIVTLHDLAPLVDPAAVSGRFAALNRRLIPALARSAATIVVDSAVIGGEIASRFGVRSSKLRIAPPGVGAIFREVAVMGKTEARQTLGLANLGIDIGRPLVGGLVSTIPRKNAEGVIETLNTIVTAGAAAAVVAGWDGPARVFGDRTRVQSRLVPDLGSITDEEVALFYRALDVFVWLPDYEGFGLPVVEAAAAGTAVVCTAVPAALEHLTPEVAIVNDTAGAIAAVRDLLTDATRRQNLTHAAAARVEELTWERTAVLVMEAAGDVQEFAQ